MSWPLRIWETCSCWSRCCSNWAAQGSQALQEAHLDISINQSINKKNELGTFVLDKYNSDCLISIYTVGTFIWGSMRNLLISVIPPWPNLPTWSRYPQYETKALFIEILICYHVFKPSFICVISVHKCISC